MLEANVGAVAFAYASFFRVWFADDAMRRTVARECECAFATRAGEMAHAIELPREALGGAARPSVRVERVARAHARRAEAREPDARYRVGDAALERGAS